MINKPLGQLETALDSLLPVTCYKRVGETPFELLKKVEEKHGGSYYHLGNLDPMAEGLMVFVPDKYRFLEFKLKKLKKTYEFSVLQGFNTDSHDLLGITTNYDIEGSNKNISKKLKKCLSYFSEEYDEQRPPKVSYKNLNSKKKLKSFHSGKSLPELDFNKVKVYDLEFTKKDRISKKRLTNYLEKSFGKLQGEFRQDKIINKYYDVLSDFPTFLNVYDFKITTSSGFYVRGLVRDISKKCGTPLTSYKIKRTKLGPFEI